MYIRKRIYGIALIIVMILLKTQGYTMKKETKKVEKKPDLSKELNAEFNKVIKEFEKKHGEKDINFIIQLERSFVKEILNFFLYRMDNVMPLKTKSFFAEVK